MTDVLLIVALKTDQSNIKRRLDVILAAAEPQERDTEPVVWAKPIEELAALDLDALASLVGWKAVERLRVGAVAGALATGESRDASASPPDGSNPASEPLPRHAGVAIRSTASSPAREA